MTLPTLVDRILERCDIGDCWIWTGSTAGKPGHMYGRLRMDGALVYTHRTVWEGLVGPIPDGLEIDHLCRVTLCCNPEHMEPVTHRENMLRSKAWVVATRRNLSLRDAGWCGSGRHQWIEANIWVAGNGTRRCRLCKQEYERLQYHRLKARP